MRSDAGTLANAGGGENELVVVILLVGVGVDAGVVADYRPFSKPDLCAVIQKGALADDDAVLDAQVIPVCQLDPVIDADTLTHLREKMPAQHAAEADAEPVIEADRRTVEHDPEPEERLAAGESLAIHVGVVLGFEGDIPRIERKLKYVERKFAGQSEVQLAPVRTAEIELEELIADDFSAALGNLVTGEFLVQEGEPAAVEFLCFRLGVSEAGGRLDSGSLGHTHEDTGQAVGAREAERSTACRVRLDEVSEQASSSWSF